MLFETRVTATPDKRRAINDSRVGISAVIAAVDVDHWRRVISRV